MPHGFTFSANDSSFRDNLLYLRNLIISTKEFNRWHFDVFVDGKPQSASSCYVRQDNFIDFDGHRVEQNRVSHVEVWFEQ